MKVVIVAAGKGERLSAAAESKPLTLLAGKPLLQHVIETAIAALPRSSENEILVVTGWRGERIREFLEAYGKTVPVKISSVQNESWEKGNGVSALAAESRIEGSFLLMMADHIIEPDILRILLDTDMSGADLALAVDKKLSNPLVDLEDVTRVHCEEARIVEIGKQLSCYNAFDTGCFRCTPPFFDALRKAQEQMDNYGISGGVQILAGNGRAKAINIDDARWIDVDTPDMLLKAEEMVVGGGLLESAKSI